MCNREGRLGRIRKLLGRYLDIARLLGDNPSVTREELDEALGELGIEVPPEMRNAECGVRNSGGDVVIYSDGAASGNPGPSGIGVVITDGSGKVLLEISESIGRATSNVAEYSALIAGLDAAGRLGAERVAICADSELLVRQLNGQYRVKSPNIRPLWAQAMQRLDALREWHASHVPREYNERADALARKAIETVDRKQGSC